jgi:hypothetical protein
MSHAGKAATKDILFNYSMAEVEYSRTAREALDKKEMDQLAMLCLGDLTADRRYDLALAKAAHFGMLDEAERIARIRALSASGAPSPK